MKNSLSSNDPFLLNHHFKILGNYLIIEEDSIKKIDQQDETVKIRHVLCPKYPYAKTVVYIHKPVFASGDDVIIVNSSNKTFEFYRYEALSDVIRRSHLIDEKRKNNVINLLNKRRLNN